MTITLSRDQRMNNDVVISKITVNNFDLSPVMVAEEIQRDNRAALVRTQVRAADIESNGWLLRGECESWVRYIRRNGGQ